MKNRKLIATTSSVAIVTGLLFVFMMNSTEEAFCKVHVGSPHLSTFFQERNNLRVVKINAYSTCSKPHSDISLTVELWKEGILLKRFVKGTITQYPGVLKPNEKFYNKDTFEICKSDRKTEYFGKVFGKAWIDGQLQRATRIVKISTSVKCGT